MRPEHLVGLLARAERLLEQRRVATLRCAIGGVQANAVALDALARVALLARRRGCAVILCGSSPQLDDLIALAGLTEVLPRE